jgi:protein TonB
MLGVLLESKATRQRRNGGAAMSVATHLAIAGAIGAFTATAPSREKEREPMPVLFVPPVIRPSINLGPPGAATKTACLCLTAPALPRITAVPPTIPPVDLAAPVDPTPGDLPLSTGQPGIGRLGAVDLGDGENSGGGRDWAGSETLMRLLVTARPRYPERMRSAGISGRVLVRFVVDTTGRVELSSVQVVQTTHDLFSSAVREVLPSLRFKPSEQNGQRVRSLAEMPFEFLISR